MSDKTKPTELTASELAAWLHSLPPETPILLETSKGHEIDVISGALYYPKQGIVSLVGQNTEIEVDDDDWDTVETFGDVSLFEDEDVGPGTDAANDSDDGIAVVEIQLPRTEIVGEVDVAIRPVR